VKRGLRDRQQSLIQSEIFGLEVEMLVKNIFHSIKNGTDGLMVDKGTTGLTTKSIFSFITPSYLSFLELDESLRRTNSQRRVSCQEIGY